jgi:hypothetical protein
MPAYSAGFSNIDFYRSLILETVSLCVAANVVIDWLSVGQTNVFFDIASEQDRAWRVALLIVSDLYITIILFITVFALPVALLLIRPTARTEENVSATVYISDAKDLPSEIPGLSAALNGFRAPKYMQFLVDVSGRPSTNIEAIAEGSSINLGDIFEALLGSKGVTLGGVQTTVRVNKGDSTKDIDIKVSRGSAEWEKLQVDEISEKDSLRVHVSPQDFLDLSINNLNYAYSAAYRAIAEVQLSFPGSAFTSPVFLRIGDVEWLHQIYFSQYSSLLFACKRGNIWRSSNSPDFVSPSCDDKIVFTKPSTSTLKSALRGTLNSDVLVPLNTLFLTSLSMTGMLYGLLFLSAIARMTWKLVARFLAPYQIILVKSPLGWAGLVIGIAIFVATSWF